MKKILYHYCSHDTFLKIIKSKEFWFGNGAMMNDPTENKIFKERCDRYLKKSKEPISSFNTKSFSQLFILSLSSTENLLCWRTYGDDGKGFAIGIDLDRINAKMSDPKYLSMNMITDVNNLHYGEIIYNRNKQYELARSFIDNQKAKQNEKKFMDTIKEYLINSSIVKHPAYKGESECRIFCRRDNLLSLDFELHYQSINNELKSFYKKPFKEFFKTNQDVFDNILIGPKNKINKNQLNEILLSNNIKYKKISKSQIPMR